MRKENKALKQLWKERLKNWELPQQSALAWCRQNDISYQSFKYWKRKLSSPQESSEPIMADSFIEITEKEADQGSGIEIEIEGMFIRLCKDFDSDALNRCCRALRGNHAVITR